MIEIERVRKILENLATVIIVLSPLIIMLAIELFAFLDPLHLLH